MTSCENPQQLPALAPSAGWAPSFVSDCGRVRLYQGDCLEVIPKIKPLVSAVITDPPYGINIKTGFNGDDKSCQFDDGFSVMFFLDRHIELWDDAIKSGGSVYVFTRFDVMPYWWLRLKGHFDMKNCIVWAKGGGGTGDLAGNYIGTHEMVLFGAKGRHLLRGKREGNVWGYNKTKPEHHPMQKPTDIIENILMHSTDKGDTVLDPFMGSGSTGVAAVKTGRNFIGVERDAAHYATALERIKRELAQGDIFLDSALPNAEISHDRERRKET